MIQQCCVKVLAVAIRHAGVQLIRGHFQADWRWAVTTAASTQELHLEKEVPEMIAGTTLSSMLCLNMWGPKRQKNFGGWVCKFKFPTGKLKTKCSYLWNQFHIIIPALSVSPILPRRHVSVSIYWTTTVIPLMPLICSFVAFRKRLYHLVLSLHCDRLLKHNFPFTVMFFKLRVTSLINSNSAFREWRSTASAT